MQIVSNIQDLQQKIAEAKKNKKKIGFVPTMGALHAGHMQLVQKSVSENDFNVVSIFVNPTQFNNPADLEKYPRNLDQDAQMLQEAGCDLIFAPSASEIYSNEEMGKTFEFDFGGLDKVMEGKFRPGHFNGVVQIVSKLFRFVSPDKAYFGEKDFQQLAIIHRMVDEMNFDVEIVDCPIVREPSGLAMSSRNERLSSVEREIASNISKVLFESRNFVQKMSPAQLTDWVIAQIDGIEGLQPEYFEIADARSLQPVNGWNAPSVGCIAVFCGDVRLIDNIRYN